MSKELYQGVKFTTIYKSQSIPDSTLINEFKAWCNIFSKKGLAPEHPDGSFGNMSFRQTSSSEAFFITRTGANLKSITEADIVFIHSCNLDKREITVSGIAEPSSESFIHASLYNVNNQNSAIFHGHSNRLLANKSIPITPNELPYGTLELMEAALSLKQHSVFNLKNHGFFSQAKTMAEAGSAVLELL